MSRLSALSQAASIASNKRDAGAALDACTLLETLPWDEEAVEKARFLARISAKRLRDDPRWYDCWERCMRWLAYGDFRCFMSFMEVGRPAADRFWAPREKSLGAVADALQQIEDGRLDELVINVPPRIGKLLSDDTPVLTADGWKRHGDLVVGDTLFSPDGMPTKVVAVHPKHHTTHTVTFSDGSSFDCHFRHEWRVWDRNAHRWRTIETQEMVGKLEEGSEGNVRGHRYRFQIEVPEPMQGIERDLPVPPYTFGAWLGDGTNKAPRITGAASDHAIIDRIAADGYNVVNEYTHRTTGVMTYDFSGPLRSDLQRLGFCHSRRRVPKRIPAEYLTASLGQRLELLAGLIDTDGCLSAKEHRYHFTTSEPQLRDDFEALVSTFGWRSCVQEHNPSESAGGVRARSAWWTVSFNPTFGIPAVLERKRLSEFSRHRRLSVVSIEESEPKPGNCITVERDGMYLVGNRLIPTHNTTIMAFWTVWRMGRHPEESHLYTSYSDTVTKAFYSGILEIVKDPDTYRYGEVFPNSPLVRTDAFNGLVDIGRRKRYASLTCRSIDGTLNGACDASGAMIGDDLCSGIEEASNPLRMERLLSKVNNDWLSRRKHGCPIIWMGTRWSVADPMGVRERTLDEDPAFAKVRWRKVSIPALNAAGRSNFYMDGRGFSKSDYERVRSQFERAGDMASWYAMYMQRPVERQGALFEMANLRTFSGEVPKGRAFMAVDPAFGGGDYTAAPVCIDDGEDIYVPAVVFSAKEKDFTLPMLADAVERWHVEKVQFEASRMLESYVDEFRRLLKERGTRTTVTMKPASTRVGKDERIHGRAPDIRQRFVFLAPADRPPEYKAFMDQVCSFTSQGKVPHDDAPDSLAMAAGMVYRFGGASQAPAIFRRSF